MEEMLLGSTDRTFFVFLADPASTDGSGKTGVAHTDLTVSYSRVETDNDVTVSDVTSSLNAITNLTDAHNDWGWKEVSNTLAPGLYRLDVADAVFASDAWYAVVYVMLTSSAASAAPKGFRLVAVNALDAVRMGMTALPNAAADAAGGLPISDAGGLDLDAVKTKTDLLTTFPANFSSLSIDNTGFVGANITNSGTAAAGGASTITLAASASTSNNYYVRQFVQIVSGTGAGQVRQISGYTGSSKSAVVNFAWVTNPDNTSVYRILAANVPHVLDLAGVTRAKTENDESIATTSYVSQRTLATADYPTASNLATVDTVVDAIKAKTDNLPAAPAAVGDIPTSTTITNAVAAQITTDHGSGAYTQNTEPLTASQTRDALGMTSANLDSQLGTLATGTDLATVDGVVDAIKAKTDQFVFTVANQVDSNALSGGGSGLDAAGVRSAVGLASANLDTQFSAIPAATASAVVAKPGSDPATTPAATATWLAKLDWLYNRFAGKIVGERSTNSVNVSEQTIYNAANTDIGSQSVTKTNTTITISKVE
jgi:hypothetical protein